MPRPALILALYLAGALPAAAWGSLGHRMAASAALLDLPPDLARWFAGQEATLPAHANDPDHWKPHDPLEGPRHFLDSEYYGSPARIPLDQAAARAQVGPETFQRAGQVLWTVQTRVDELTRAFQANDATHAAFVAAILCHYVADLSVPLHTTRNHDGAETGQHGIHGRWETRTLEAVAQDGWLPEVRPAELGPDAFNAPWAWREASYALVPGLLADDLSAQAGAAGADPLGAGYFRIFLELQGPHVKEQLTLSAQRTAEMILLAWTRAGSPPSPVPAAAGAQASR